MYPPGNCTIAAVLPSDDEDDCARSLCLRQGLLQVLDLVARQLAPVRVRQVTICDRHGHLAENGFDANSTIGILRPADLNSGCLGIVGYNLPVREAQETAREGIDALRRDVDPVLWDRFEGRIGRLRRMPIELHVDATRPLNHRIEADRIVKDPHETTSAHD